MSDGTMPASPAECVLYPTAPRLFTWLRRLHRWLGLTLAIPLLIIGLTGFILVIFPPLDDLSAPRASVSGWSDQHLDDGPTIAAIVEAAIGVVGGDVVPIRYRFRDAAQVDFAPVGHRIATVRVFIDPATQIVLRVTDQPDRFYHWIHNLHENLLLPPPFGHDVTGSIGLGLICLSLLGIPIWWPRGGRWKAAVTVSSRSAGYRFQREVHGASAIWIVAMLLLQSFSGASMAFPQTFRAVFAGAPTGNRVAVAPDAPATLKQAGSIPGSRDITPASAIERLVREAHAALPDATLVDLRMPAEPGRPYVMVLLRNSSPRDAPTAVVTLDPTTLRLISVQDPSRAVPGIRFLVWLRALHSGQGLGPLWRTAIAVLGLTLPVISFTGAAMWILRRGHRRRRARLRGEMMQRAGE